MEAWLITWEVPPVTIHQFSRRGETRSDASEIRKAA